MSITTTPPTVKFDNGHRSEAMSPVAEQKSTGEGEEEDDDGEDQLELLIFIFVGKSVSQCRGRTLQGDTNIPLQSGPLLMMNQWDSL